MNGHLLAISPMTEIVQSNKSSNETTFIYDVVEFDNFFYGFFLRLKLIYTFKTLV